MKTNSINDSNGCSVCQAGQENYTTFVAGAFRGTEYYQYDYRTPEGTLFSTVAKSLEECRKRRDEWLNRKAVLQMLNDWWLKLSFDELETITGIEQDKDGNNEEDARFIDNANQFWQSKTFEEKTKIYKSNFIKKE